MCIFSRTKLNRRFTGKREETRKKYYNNNITKHFNNSCNIVWLKSISYFLMNDDDLDVVMSNVMLYGWLQRETGRARRQRKQIIALRKWLLFRFWMRAHTKTILTDDWIRLQCCTRNAVYRVSRSLWLLIREYKRHGVSVIIHNILHNNSLNFIFISYTHAVANVRNAQLSEPS